jgi:hypothetical protein
MEYYFFLNAAGRVSLAPFELSVPAPEIPEAQEPPEAPANTMNTGDTGEIRRIRFPSPAIRFLVRAPGEAGAGSSSPERNIRLFWESALLYAGEEAELSLRGWDPRLPLPSPGLLLPRTPVGAILEASPPQENDRAAGILLRVRLIPLEEGRLNIPGFSVPLGDYRLDIPALSVPVGPATKQDQRGAVSPAPLLEEAPSPASGHSVRDSAGDSFPETALKPFPPFRAGCLSIRERALALWDRGLRVEALAELRRNERDYAGGPALIPLRRDVERLMGLSENGDETWRPRILLAAIFLVSAALMTGIFLSLLSPKKRVTPGPAWCYKVIGKSYGKTEALPQQALKRGRLRVLGIFAVLSVFLGFFFLKPEGVFGPSRPALTRETEAFRVPGPEGTEVFRFEEGRRVSVRSVRGGWAYAEIPGSGGKAGWLRTEALLFY